MIIIRFIVTVLLLVLAAGPAAARGTPGNPLAIDSMRRHCTCAMQGGSCVNYLAARDALPPSDLAMPVQLGGVDIDGRAWTATVPATFWHAWNANDAMCPQLVVDCALGWDTPGCYVSRSQFRQDFAFDCDAAVRDPVPAQLPEPTVAATRAPPIELLSTDAIVASMMAACFILLALSRERSTRRAPRPIA